MVSTPLSIARTLFSRVQAAYWESRARNCYERDDSEGALVASERLIRVHPRNPFGLFVLSSAHLSNGDYGRARPYLIELSYIWPGDSWTWFALGVCADQLNFIEDAVVAYQRSIWLSPEWERPKKCLGRALYLANRHQEARRVLQDYCHRCSDDREAHDLLGFVCYQLGEYHASFAHYDRATMLAPEDARLSKNARLLYRKMARS